MSPGALSRGSQRRYEAHYIRRQDLKGFLCGWSAKYPEPFLHTAADPGGVGHEPGAGSRVGKKAG